MIFLKAISNCHYHKFMFKLSKKQSKVRNIIIDVLSRSPKTDHGTKWSISLLQIYLGSTLVSSSGVCLKTCIFCSTVSRSLRVSTKEAFDLNALTMAFCINTASIPIKFFKVTYSGIFRRYEKIWFFKAAGRRRNDHQVLPIVYKIAQYKIYALS